MLQAGNSAEALAVIDAALGAGPQDPALYNLKGLAASELGRDQEAEQSFRTVIRLAPKAAMGYNNLGVLQAKLGHYQDAAASFRKAQVREPENFTSLLGLGASLAALQKYGEAASYLQKAWKVRPRDFQTGYEWAHALLQSKQPAAAKKVLDQMSAPQEPESAVKYYSLSGVVAEGVNEFGPAARLYRQAFQIDPGSYEIYLALVRATLSAGLSPGGEDVPAPPENLSATQDLTLGQLYASHDAYERAIPPFEKASGTRSLGCGRYPESRAGLQKRWQIAGCKRPAAPRTCLPIRRPNSTTHSATWRKTRASIWRRSRAFRGPSSLIQPTKSITSTWAWSISPTLRLDLPLRFTASARRNFHPLRGSILG